jgi:ERCC4-related helicase
MKEYNFDEMQKMQAKALERVRDMQARAQTVAREADRELSGNSETEHRKTQTENAYKDNFYNAVKSTPNKNRISMPVELPQSKPYESFKEYFEPINKKAKQENEKTVKADLLDTVFKEPDKALLLALLLLLQADGADEELLMSLLYIML